MSTLTAAETSAIFDEHQAKFAPLKDKIDEMRSLYTARLWHQMGDSMLNYVNDKQFDMSEGNELVHMYEKMIQKLDDRLNPIKYALITIACSRHFENIEDAIKFLQEAATRMKNHTFAVFLLRIAQAEKKLTLGNHHDCIEELTEIRRQVEKHGDTEPKVYSNMAHVFGLYYNRRDDFENYFKSCMQYLAYTPADEMPDKEKKELSIKMGMAILLGKNVFNITELLEKEVINSLVGTEYEWLFHLMKSLAKGKITEFEKTFKDNLQVIEQRFPKVYKQKTYLEQKVRIIAFLELIFELGKDERSIPFTRIASVCQIDQKDVELLLLKSLSLELVRGTIDEVDQVVHIEWSMPRYLNKDHLQIMHKKMQVWELKMEDVIRQCEEKATELMSN